MNFEDPFGLCPPRDTNTADCRAILIGGAKTKNMRLWNSLNSIAVEQGHNLFVYSAYRDPEHNKAVGGVPTSGHTQDVAADVIFEGMNKVETADALFHSEVRQKGDLQLIYHGPGGAVPEHSHLEVTGGADLRELPTTKDKKGKTERNWEFLTDPVKH